MVKRAASEKEGKGDTLSCGAACWARLEQTREEREIEDIIVGSVYDYIPTPPHTCKNDNVRIASEQKCCGDSNTIEWRQRHYIETNDNRRRQLKMMDCQ